MIRGVNRQIIEINDTNNKIFERAVLYVRPEYQNINFGKLEKSANNYIENLTANDNFNIISSKKKKHISLKIILPSAIAAVVGIVLLITFL